MTRSAKVIPIRPPEVPEPAAVRAGDPIAVPHPAPMADTPSATPPDEAAELQASIAAAVSGDAHAAQRLLLRVLSRVRNLIRYLVRGEDVDDLTQDVLLKLLERLSSFRGEGRFESWVDAVTLRVTLRSMGKRRLDHTRFPREMPDEPPALISTSSSATHLASKRAVEALDRLPPPQRVALVMHHVLGMTVNEIASEVEAPGETVRSRLRVGMRQLRELMGLTQGEEP